MRHYVYEIRNARNGMRYIGVRSCRCAPEDDVYWSSSKYVKAAIAAEGLDRFAKIVLAEFTARVAAVEREVALHQTWDVGRNPNFYNRAKQKTTGFDTAGLTGPLNGNYGKSASAETRLKLSLRMRGRPSPWKGKSASAATREVLRQANLGKTYSADTKEKHRQAILGKRLGANHPMYGKHHTEESKQRTSAALRGRPKSAEMKARLSATQQERACGFSGRSHSQASRDKTSASLRRAYRLGLRNRKKAA